MIRRTLLLSLALAAAAVSFPVAAETTTAAAGQRAYDRRNPVAARQIWSVAAAAGDAQAQFDLGLLYDLGEGVQRDPARALAFYRAAANAGLTAAQFNVAVMYDSGRGTPRDAAAAALWYARAAANGHARAQYNLAQLYDSGDGVPQNPAQAKCWYLAAAANGIPAAAHRAASILADPAATLAAARLQAPRPTNAQGGHTELVWSAPAEPPGTRFFVTVVAIGHDATREVVAQSTHLSALAIEVPAADTRYAWRVYTVADREAHYAASDWTSLPTRPRS